MKKKIVVVGNCQARPLATAFEKLGDSVEVTAIAIVHLLKSEQFYQYHQHFEQADIIVSQRVANNYPCEFVQTDFLKNKYGSKVVVIVNLYFSGYNPDWCYLRIPEKGPLRGPMGDYHNKTILKSWKKGFDVEQASELLLDYHNNMTYSIVKDQSLAELSTREVNTDIRITDFIQKNMFQERLFFTFNHPSASLLVEYAKRILRYKCINYNEHLIDFGGAEPLSQFIPLVNPASGLPNGLTTSPHGMSFEVREDNVYLKSKKIYNLSELIESFYFVYDSFSSQIHSLKNVGK